MAKFVVFSFILLVLEINCNVIKTPRSLVDEAREQLEDLKSLVQGTIFAATNEIEDIEYDFLTYGHTLLEEGLQRTEEQEQFLQSQINTVKELASSQGRNVTSCLEPYEEIASTLPVKHADELRNCILDGNKEEAVLVGNAKYIIDVAMTKVHNLEFQFRRCGEELLCISPLVTEIELSKIRLPQNINSEVLAVDTLMSSVKNSVKFCSDSNTSYFMATTSSLVRSIASCAYGVL